MSIDLTSLRDLFAAAYIEGLEQKARLHPLSEPAPAPRLDDTGRAPNVPLEPARRRTVPNQCYGCGRFIGPRDPAWATAYHPECEPGARRG